MTDLKAWLSSPVGTGIGGPLPTPLLPTDDDDSCLVLSDAESEAKATLEEVGAERFPGAAVSVSDPAVASTPGSEASLPGRDASSPRVGASPLTIAAEPLIAASDADRQRSSADRSISVDPSISW